MNFEKCAFCRKRIPKTARLDAVYCSPKCRMNALRIRKREKRMAERAEAKAKEGKASDAQVRQQAQRAAFLVRIQGARLAAAQPNLVEDQWLNLRAEVAACDKMISYYTEKKKHLQAQLERLSEPKMNYYYRDIKASDPTPLSDKDKAATRIGLAIQPGEFEGDAMIYLASPCGRNDYPSTDNYYAGRSKFDFGPQSGR